MRYSDWLLHKQQGESPDSDWLASVPEPQQPIMRSRMTDAEYQQWLNGADQAIAQTQPAAQPKTRSQQPPKLFPDFDRDKAINALRYQETQGIANPWVRTSQQPKGGSTAYGPSQITGKTFRDIVTRYKDQLGEHMDAINNQLLPMYEKFQMYGREPNKPGYDPRYDYGGAGDPLDDAGRAAYYQVERLLMEDRLKKLDSNLSGYELAEALRFLWRGKVADPDHQKRFYQSWNGVV